MPGYKVAIYSPSLNKVVYDAESSLIPGDQLLLVGEKERALLDAEMAKGTATDWVGQPEWVVD
jgi:hypothetical protein